MRHPNGYGSVAKLSGNRRKPYVVRKTKGFDDRGYPIYDLIGYYPTRQEGLIALAEYNKNPYDISNRKITFAELYALWLEKKAHKLGDSNVRMLKTAYNKHTLSLRTTPYRDIKSFHMQDVIDKCEKSYATKNGIKNLFYHLDRFALETEVVDKTYSQLTLAESIPETTKTPFTSDEIAKVWSKQDEAWMDSVLIFLYSGWRISELIGLQRDNVDITAGTMTGGVKTQSGKNRIVPIHSKISDIIKRRYDEGNEYLLSHKDIKLTLKTYYNIWDDLMKSCGLDHTPHETRHTLRSAMDSAGANKVCIDLIMGHKSKEVGERIYTHKTLQELKDAIELVTY